MKFGQSAPIRLGVDAACWTNTRGYGRFTRGLLAALAGRDDISMTFLADRATARRIEPPANVTLLVAPVDESVADSASSEGRRSIFDLVRMGRAAAAGRFDLFFFPSVYSYFPMFDRTPQVVTVHDAIPETFPSLVFPNRWLRFFWRAKLRWALGSAKLVFTVSPFAERQIRVRLGVSAARLRVLTEAPDPVFRPVALDERAATLSRRGLEDSKYLLYVGGLSPHKDLPTAIRAFAQLKSTHGDLRLVFAGETADDRFFTQPGTLRSLAETLGVESQVDWLGYVSDHELAALYSGALALVLPSLAEGFGLPAIEAAACACPVVASDSSGAADIVGRGARVFPVGDADALTHIVTALLSDPDERRRLGDAGLEQASRFTWDHAAELAATSFREVLSGDC